MKKILTLTIVFLMTTPLISALVGIVSAKYYNIRIDGNFSDWNGVPTLVSDSKETSTGVYDISECYMANTGTYLFIRIDRYASGGEKTTLAMSTYLDTDQNSATGLSIHGIGADYKLVFSYGDPGWNQLWKRSGGSWVWKANPAFKFGPAGSRYGYETRLYRGWIGDPEGVDVAFIVSNSGDWAPDSGHVSYYLWPTAHIEKVKTDKTSYNFGDTIEVSVNIDTTKPSQNIEWIAELLDPHGNQKDWDSRSYTVYGSQVDYKSVNLQVPFSGLEGDWRIKVTLADDDTHEIEDEKTIYRKIPTPVPDFSINVNPDSGEAPPGGSTTATVTLTSINGYSHSVSLSASGQPSDVTISFSPTSGTPTFTSTMTAQVASSVAPKDYPITITGTGSDGTVHSTTYTLTVTQAPVPAHTISLKSRTTDGLENINNSLGTTIVFDSDPYNVPKLISKTDGTYIAQANPPGSYSFHNWEYSGGVSVSNEYANPTQVSVSGDGELKAVFFYDILLVFSTAEKYYPVKGLGYDGDSDITNNYANYQESTHAIPDIDLDSTRDAPAYLHKTVDGGYTVLEYWIYYAYDNKKIADLLPIWRHEHDFESVYLWIDSNFVITKIALSQHQWANNYWRAIPRKIYIGVEEGGHGMLMLDSSFNTLKPDNSDLKPPLSGTFSASSENATLYPWKTYTDIPLDDGFGDSGNLMKARWEWGPFPFLGTAHLDASIFYPLISIDYINIGLNIFKSITDPILLRSSSPVDDWFFTSILYKFYLTAPWVRREFEDASLQSIRLSYSHWNVKTWANFIVNWASNGLKGSIFSLTKNLPKAVKFVAFGLPNWLHIINDPANLAIVDSEGNILGYKDGELVSEIPGGIVLAKSQNYEIYLLSNNATNFKYSILGQAPQTYNLTVIAAWFNETLSDVQFDAINIPLEAASEHIYEMDWEILRQAEDGTSVEIDQNGDGINEQTIQTGTTLTSDQIGGGYAYTDKSQYTEGEIITVGFQNTGSTTITLSTTAPWVILEDSMVIVYRAIGLLIPVDVGPGEKKEWQWNQEDDYSQQVPPGTYFFQIETSAGNFTAGFSIVDVTPPAIDILSPENTTYTTNTVDLTFIISELTSWIGYSLDGQANVTITGNTVLADLTEGSHHVILYANDTSGNMGFSSRVSFTIDTVPPTTSISLSGTIGLNDWYVSDVTVTLTATDDVSGVSLTEYSFDGTTWVTYKGPFTISDEGITTIYYNSTDNAGNTEEPKRKEIKIDKTLPYKTVDLMGTLGDNGWYLSEVTITITPDDDVSGVCDVKYSFDNVTWIDYTGPFTIGTEGTSTLTINVTDCAGNLETGTFDVKIDKTPPDLTKSLSGTLGNNDWYVSDVTVTLSGSDTVSGLASIQYSFDGTIWDTYSTPLMISDEGITTFYHKASDFAGNEFVLPSQQIKIDKTSPATTDSLSGTFSNGWYTSDVTITLDAFDATSGFENIYYKVDNGVEQIYSAPFIVSGDGPHVIEFWSTDNAGNIETHHTDTFQIDTTASMTTASLSGTPGLNDWYVTSVQVTLTAEDPSESSIPPTGSGIYKTYYILNGGPQEEYSGPFAVSGQGSHTVQFWSIDIAGNTEAANTVGFKIDTIEPVTTVSQSPDGNNGWWKTSPATVTLSASDATSGVMEIHYQVDSGSYMVVLGASALVTVEGNGIHSISYYAVDHAGNQEAEKTETVKIDTTSPTTTLDIGAPQSTIGPDVYVTSTTSFTLSPSDNPEGSDVAATYYRVYPVSTAPPPFTPGTSFHIGSEDGEYVIEYYSFDNAGNDEIVNSLTVILDNTPPTTTKTVGLPSFDDFVTSATQFSLEASDGGADVASTHYRINGGTWALYADPFFLSGPDGVYMIEFYSLDNLGNTEDTLSQIHTLDNTAPSSSILLSGAEGDNDWFVSGVSTTLLADDGLGSGVATIYYILDGGDAELYSAPFPVSEQGMHTIEFWSVDNLGNTESPYNTCSFKIDTIAPSTSASLNPENPNGENDWYTVPVEVTLTACDETSRVAATYYRINDGSQHSYSIPFAISDDGIYTVQFWSIDNAGNSEPPNTVSFQIDQTAPTTTLTIGLPKHEDNPTYVSPTTDFTLEATDATSGVNFIEYKIDDEAWTLCTAPFNVLEFGPHKVYYHSVDNAGNIEEVQSASIVVAATSTEYLGPITGQYSDPITVEAQLIDIATQQPIPSKTINFTVGSQSEISVTDSEGIATTSITLDQPAGPYPVSAAFEGDEEYLASSDSKPFTVEKEIAEVEYTGDTVVPTTAKTIDLRATVFDSPDSSWGELTKIQVTFSIYAGLLGSTPFMTIPAVPVSQTDMPGVGVAVTSIVNDFPENGYLIIVNIDSNDYYEGPTSDATPLTVYEPTGDFVTGGGWIWDPSGSKGNFGFNVKYTKSGKPQGHATYVYREGGWDVIVKSNSWIGLAIDGNHAAFEAKCVVQKYNPATGELLWAEGNYKFRVDVWDNDSDGGVDAYQIRVRDKHGVVYHEAGFDPLGELQGGNIVIHDERKKKP